jgi:hypothetical protein
MIGLFVIWLVLYQVLVLESPMTRERKIYCIALGKSNFVKNGKEGTMVTDWNIVNFEYATSGQGKPNELWKKRKCTWGALAEVVVENVH